MGINARITLPGDVRVKAQRKTKLPYSCTVKQQR